MAIFKWIKNDVPTNLEIKQVYGVVFSSDGKILLRIDEDKYKLTGGKPEYNETFEETLKREFIEELNVEIENTFYLGYLLVNEGEVPYAQVRMIATIKNVYNNRPDIDNGKMYKRFLANFNNVKKYLNYEDKAGNELIEDAIKLAQEKYKFEINEEEYYI